MKPESETFNGGVQEFVSGMRIVENYSRLFSGFQPVCDSPRRFPDHPRPDGAVFHLLDGFPNRLAFFDVEGFEWDKPAPNIRIVFHFRSSYLRNFIPMQR
jgi:hypothetical protein